MKCSGKSDLKKLNDKISCLKKEIKKYKNLAFIDSLTRAYTRIWFLTTIKNNNRNYFMTMVDINDLKKMNDKFGHLAGDKYIVDIVKKIKQFGTVVRYGGDEFLVLTKDEEKFNSLNEIKTNEFCCGGVRKGDYSFISEAIRKADEKLYEAKNKKV